MNKQIVCVQYKPRSKFKLMLKVFFFFMFRLKSHMHTCAQTCRFYSQQQLHADLVQELSLEQIGFVVLDPPPCTLKKKSENDGEIVLYSTKQIATV